MSASSDAGARRVRRLKRSFRKLASRALPPIPGAAILGYHRVADPAEIVGGDPFALCISPAAFRHQMAALREIGRPVSLPHLAESLRGGVPVRGMIAVTFDDAYEDVLHQALPVLEEYEIPATVYFVSGNPGRPFWWDVLTGLLATVDITVPFRVQAGNCEISWNGMGSPRALRVSLHRALRIRDDVERETILERLATTWQTRPPRVLPRALDETGCRRLLSSPCVAGGVHTVSHAPLGEVSPARAQVEINQARTDLIERFGRGFDSFSYPHGNRTPAVQRYVAAAGYRTACGGQRDSVRKETDLLALPRVWVPNESIGSFKRLLRRFVGS